MGFSYHYSFRAAPSATAEELAAFLQGVEGDARLMGFDPTIVFAGPIDTAERKAFARRIARPLTVEDERLRNRKLPESVCWAYLPDAGVCRLAPIECAVLVVTDERQRESVFGFFRFPAVIRDAHGKEIMHVRDAMAWSAGGFIDSPDARYRGIVRRFRDAGYLESEHDEFASAAATQ